MFKRYSSFWKTEKALFPTCFDFLIFDMSVNLLSCMKPLLLNTCPLVFYLFRKAHPLTPHFIIFEFLYSFEFLISWMAQELNYSKKQSTWLGIPAFSFNAGPFCLLWYSVLIFRDGEWRPIRPEGSHRRRWGSTLTISYPMSTRQRPLLWNRFGMSKDHKSQSCFVIPKVLSGPTMEAISDSCLQVLTNYDLPRNRSVAWS